MPAKGPQGAALQGRNVTEHDEHDGRTLPSESAADGREAVSNLAAILNAPEAGLACQVLSVASESTLSSAQHGVPPTPCTTETITANSSENSCGAPANCHASEQAGSQMDDEHAEPVHAAAGSAVMHHHHGVSTSHAAYLLSADASYASQGYESEDGIPMSPLQRQSHRAAAGAAGTRQIPACLHHAWLIVAPSMTPARIMHRTAVSTN